MTLRPRLLPLLALGAALIWGGAEAAGPTVKVDQATQRRLGLMLATPTPARRAATITGFARVLDPGPLASLESDLAQAAAAAQASAAELKRAKVLNAADQTVSNKAVEAAQAQARADEAKLGLLKRRIGLEWGPGLARMSDKGRASLVDAVAAGHAALIRIDTPSGHGLQGLTRAEIDLGSLGTVHAQILGAARTADAQLLSPGLIAIATGPRAESLSSGLTAPVQLATAGPAAGVILPRSALIRAQGQTWAYVRTDATTFERRAATGGIADPAGLFAPQGFSASDQVVVSGAAALFAAETGGGKEED